MRLKITKRDIKYGIQGRSDMCPIALALRRAYPNFEPRVLPNQASLIRPYPSREHYISSFSRRAMKFIAEYDRRRTVRPLTIRLSFPKEVS